MSTIYVDFRAACAADRTLTNLLPAEAGVTLAVGVPAELLGQVERIDPGPQDEGRLDMFQARAREAGANGHIYARGGTVTLVLTRRQVMKAWAWHTTREAERFAREAERGHTNPRPPAMSGCSDRCRCSRCAREGQEVRDFLRTYVGA